MITKCAYLKLTKFGLKSLRIYAMVHLNYQTKIRLTYIKMHGLAMVVWVSYRRSEEGGRAVTQVMKHI